MLDNVGHDLGDIGIASLEQDTFVTAVAAHDNNRFPLVHDDDDN